MAVYGSLVSNVWRAYATASVTNTSNTICTVTCTAGINVPTSGYTTHRSFRATAYISGTTYSASGTRADQQYKGVNTTGIATKSQQFTRTHSAYTVNYHGYLATPSSGSVSSSSTTSYGTVSIPAKPSYSVTYNANGGTGAPGASTKWYGETLTLSSTRPTRTGYSFLGWSTSSTATTATYAAGGSYTANAAASLYAVWKPDTYAVTYNSNGGSGTIADDTKTYAVNMTLSDGTGFTRTNHSLVKWNTAADGSGTDYALGATYTGNAALDLYAQWHLDYIKPTISGFDCFRTASSSSTAEKDDGTYIRVVFDYQGGTLDAGSSYIAPTCKITIDGTQKYSGALSTSGSFAVNLGTYSADTTHTVVVTLYDSTDTSGTAETGTIPTAVYPIDVHGETVNGSVQVYMGLMHPYQSGQPVTMADTTVDGTLSVESALDVEDAITAKNDIIIYIDDNAAAGTVDGDLYDALYDLGWI